MAIDPHTILEHFRQLSLAEQTRLLEQLEVELAHQREKRQHVEQLDQRSRHAPTLEQLVAEQQVSVLTSLSELESQLWPEDEPLDEFISWRADRAERET